MFLWNDISRSDCGNNVIDLEGTLFRKYTLHYFESKGRGMTSEKVETGNSALGGETHNFVIGLGDTIRRSYRT